MREHTPPCDCSADEETKQRSSGCGLKTSLCVDVPWTEVRSLVPPHLSSREHLRINLSTSFRRCSERASPPTPPVPPQSVSVSHWDPGKLWKNLPLIPPPFASFLTLQSGSWKHTCLPSLLVISKSQPRGLVQDFGLLQTGLLSGSERPPFIPSVDVGLRERRGRMGKESAVAVTAASASVTVSGSLAGNAFHFSFSLPLSTPPPIIPPFLSHSLSATAPAVWIHNSARCRAYREGTVSQRLGRNGSEDLRVGSTLKHRKRRHHPLRQ